MKALIFIRDIFKKFPLLLTANTSLIFAGSLIDAVSVFSLIIVVDLFLNPGLATASPITLRIVAAMKSFGLPVSLGWLLVFFLFFNFLKIIFQIFAQYSILQTKYAVLRDITLGTFEDFFNARWYFFSSGKQGVFLNTFIREIVVVGDAFGAMGRYFSSILQIILYLIVPFYLSWQVTSVSITMALIFALPFFFLSRVSYRLGKANTATNNRMGSVIQENLNLAKLILGFGRQQSSGENLKQAFEAHCQATLKSQILIFSLPLLYYPFGLVVLISGFFVAKRFALPLSETVVLFYSLVRLLPLIGNLTEQKSSLDNFFPSYEQVLNLRNRAKQLKQASGTRVFGGLKQEIKFNQVSFGYPEHDLILENINLSIPKARMLAIVGESGVGKSTLIDLIMGFSQPVSGSITIDGVSLQELEINSYRHHIGYVPQDSVLFNMSIRDNLLWASPDASDEQIRPACQQANAEEFIQNLPEGYATLVGDRGVLLSGGQIQRIALARAILRSPDLLILDEATSALDSYSERLIQEALNSLAHKTTIIVVAHRLSTISHADYIYVLKDGRIAQEGTYAELMQVEGHFQKMARLQTLEVTNQ